MARKFNIGLFIMSINGHMRYFSTFLFESLFCFSSPCFLVSLCKQVCTRGNLKKLRLLFLKKEQVEKLLLKRGEGIPAIHLWNESFLLFHCKSLRCLYLECNASISRLLFSSLLVVVHDNNIGKKTSRHPTCTKSFENICLYQKYPWERTYLLRQKIFYSLCQFRNWYCLFIYQFI